MSIRRLKTVHSLTHPSAKIDKGAGATTPGGSASGGSGIPSLVADDKPRLDPEALEALAAVVDRDVRSSRAAEPHDGATALMAALASENDEDEGG